MEKVVVAYSGGLDTSYCVKYLQNELNMEVHSVLVNTGGFSADELKVVEGKAYDMGVKSHTNKNILDIYYEKAIKYMVYGNVLKNGIPVAIVGEPNVGKSTLLNALLNEEKAIVSHIAGTTRDAIEDDLTINGVTYRFIDTAGIRETKDESESLGIKKTFVNI